MFGQPRKRDRNAEKWGSVGKRRNVGSVGARGNLGNALGFRRYDWKV